MITYEDETGKKAIYRGSITKGFNNWKRGKKIYNKDKKGIGLLVSDEIKAKWKNFAKDNNFSTVSKLIREAVNFYMEHISEKILIKNLSEISHDLKEPLTSIKGFSELMIKNGSNQLDPDILFRIKEIYEKSIFLENKINELLNGIEPESSQYDILIIEDDTATIMVLEEFFKMEGYSCKGVTSGTRGLEELRRSIPKLILLDIILPDISGFDICKQIKSDEKLEDIPIYYITAIPELDARKGLEETKAEGLLQKPFKFSDFKVLLDYLNKRNKRNNRDKFSYSY